MASNSNETKISLQVGSELRIGDIVIDNPELELAADDRAADAVLVYRFDAKAYLAKAPTGMEMHNVPMAEVIRLIGKHGGVLHEVLMDYWTGLYGSHTFFGVKSA